MELFKSGLKTVLGTQGSSGQAPEQNKGAETVERLVDRLQSSTLLEDRRDACRALRSLSKKYRVEVGAQGMDSLINCLAVDKADVEITSYALEALLSITSPQLLEDEEESMSNVGKQFTEIFIKKSENVGILLATLEEYDFRIRLPLVRLITNLLINRPREIQDILLVSPMGVSKLMDLLSDSREVVRNDALLLLIALTKSNSSIQKIIAFENGFDKILQIIQEEGYSDGGPIVEDCLQLFLNLLRSNTSNQTFFREGSYIKRLLPFFSLPPDEMGWPTQKVANVYHMFRIVRTLVSPLNPTQVTQACQKAMSGCGILECLCSILMASGVPAETLTEAIVTVGELIRGSLLNQEYFSSVMAPSVPPRPALVIILMTLVNDRQPLSLRCAVLYCVQCYLFKNDKGQGDIIRTLLPSSNDPANNVTAGQLLCSGLFSRDMSSNWFSSIALSHALLDNQTKKESLLKVQLVTKPNSPPITLLNHILSALQQDLKTEVKLGFLQFLSIWLESCPSAITHFLSNGNSIPYLINQITSTDSEDKEAIVHGLCAFLMGLCLYFNPNTVPSFTQENLFQLITNRIGMETLTDGLSQISKSEPYLHSLKHPQILAKHSTDLVFDHNFCLLFKKYESLILLQLNNDPHARQQVQDTQATDHSGSGYMVTQRESPNEVINRYKEVIRSQDEQLEASRKEIEGLTYLNEEHKAKHEEVLGEVLQLKSQLALAQAHKETQMVTRQVPEDYHLYHMAEKDRKIEELQLQLLKLEQNYNGLSPVKNPMQEELIGNLEEENKALVEEVEKTKKDQDELLELLAAQDNQILELKDQLRALGVDIPKDDDEDNEEEQEESAPAETEIVHVHVDSEQSNESGFQVVEHVNPRDPAPAHSQLAQNVVNLLNLREELEAEVKSYSKPETVPSAPPQEPVPVPVPMYNVMGQGQFHGDEGNHVPVPMYNVMGQFHGDEGNNVPVPMYNVIGQGQHRGDEGNHVPVPIPMYNVMEQHHGDESNSNGNSNGFQFASNVFGNSTQRDFSAFLQ